MTVGINIFGVTFRLYAAAKALYSAYCRRNLDDCASANAWWLTLKGHVFSAELDIPPLHSPGGALVSDPAWKAELLSVWFDSKQSRDIVELPQTCHPRPAFCGIAFRAREVERQLLDLDPNGGVYPQVWLFTYVFQKTASVLASKLSRLFRRLLLCGEFPLDWRTTDVTPIPKWRLSATIFRKGFRKVDLCVLVAFWRDLGSCHPTSTHTGRVWVPVMLFWTSSVLVTWNWTGVATSTCPD